MTRPRRTGSLVATPKRGSSPVYRWPGSGMPCSMTVVRVPPLSQNSSLKWVTWTSVRSSRSAGLAARDAALRRYGLTRFLDDWDRVLKEVMG